MSYTDKSYCMTASYNGAVIWNSLERKQRTMIFEPIPVKVGKQGKTIKQNKDGKSLCLLSRDYKGFGNQEMNGVAENVRFNNESSGSN